MRASWKLGRIAGIDLYVHWTFALLLVFIAGRSGGLAAVALTIAAFGCVLLHELGHALAARLYRIGTADITIYPIGGVARLERMPHASGPELVIALAGPAVNVAIAFALGIMTSVLAALGEWPLRLALTELFWINVGLAAFNLLPVFPMDGGRVVRALLSNWVGRVRATTIAATLGRALALAAGCYFFLEGMYVQVFLAAFIYFAAGVELTQVLAEADRRIRWNFPGFGPTPHRPGQVPPGYGWVQRGQGVWQLAPIQVHADASYRRRSWN